MSRTSSLLLAGAVLAAALAPAAVAGAAPQGKADKAKAEHERIVAYWTPERMKAAKPRDFERLPDGSFRQVKPARGPGGTKGKPGGGGGGGTTVCSGDVPTTSGASWECNGLVKKLTGKVLFTMGGQQYVCSGAVADDGGAGADAKQNALVLTAGHCVWDQQAGKFATNWMFYPDFDAKPNTTCSSSQYGCWTATSLVADRGFTDQTAFNSEAIPHDFAFAVVGPGGNDDSELDARMGGEYPVAAAASLGPVTAFGYPQASPYDGTDLVFCNGTPFTDSGLANLTWGLGCTMTGGASGGPWISGVGLDGNSLGTLVSLNSYKYNGRRGAAYMYGPKFNSSTMDVWDVAKDVAAGGTKTLSNVEVG